MTVEASNPRVDERAASAGTTVRFALLVVLVVVSSALMTMESAYWLSSSDTSRCELAEGLDPYGSTPLAFGDTIEQLGPYLACLNRYAPPPAWWIPVLIPVVVVALGAVVFSAMPAWRIRRGRLVPVEAIDQNGELRLVLSELIAVAGLERAPRFVVDPSAEPPSAVVFGRNRRPTVCLYGGLLAERNSAPEAFRAVVLHELAHVRNGDITLTYLTVSIWRVFLAVVLPPYLVLSGITIAGWASSPQFSSATKPGIRDLMLAVVMGTLIYLARADVLRSREIYADVTAARWGADPRRWQREQAAPAPEGWRRVRAASAELWRTHPDWQLRRESLRDPIALFGASALLMFLTGAAATLINRDLAFAFAEYRVSIFGAFGEWLHQAAALATAVLVAGVAGIALWRATLRAVVTSAPVPSGARAGLWLGGGMVVLELLSGQVSAGQWLPPQPEVLVLVVLAGVVFLCWVGQCAQLWVRVWRGRSARPAMILGLSGGYLGLSWWFAWWESGGGLVLTAGWPFSFAGTRQLLGQELAGASPSRAAAVSGIAVVFAMVHTVLADFFSLPFTPIALAALWVTPLAALLIRPSAAAARWVRDAVGHDAPTGEVFARALPSLRRVLIPGLVAGVACSVAVIGVRTYIHSLPTPAPQQAGDYALRYLAWVGVAIAAAAVIAAVSASAMTSRYRLVVALIAAETAVLIGYAGASVLISRDGCVKPSNAPWPSCSWHPVSPWHSFQSQLTFFLEPAFALGALLAFAAAAGVAAFGRAKLPRPLVEYATSGQARRSISRVGAATLGAVVLVVAGTDSTLVTRQYSHPLDYARLQQAAQFALAPSDITPSAQTRAAQVRAWSDLGGGSLISHVEGDWSRYSSALKEVAAAPPVTWSVLRTRFSPICGDISQVAGIAYGYFRVPDASAQTYWLQVMMIASKGSQDCMRALGQGNFSLFTTSFRELAQAQADCDSTHARIVAVENTGG